MDYFWCDICSKFDLRKNELDSLLLIRDSGNLADDLD